MLILMFVLAVKGWINAKGRPKNKKRVFDRVGHVL